MARDKVPLTKIDGAPDRSDVRPGMAYFVGTGPPGKTCGSCKHRGYYIRIAGYDPYWSPGCAMFHQLSGQHGPKIKPDWDACKYYEQGSSTK